MTQNAAIYMSVLVASCYGEAEYEWTGGVGWEVESLWVRGHKNLFQEIFLMLGSGVDIAYPSLRRKAAKISFCGKHGKEGVRVPTCCSGTSRRQRKRRKGFSDEVSSFSYQQKQFIYRKQKIQLPGVSHPRLPFFHLVFTWFNNLLVFQHPEVLQPQGFR